MVCPTIHAFRSFCCSLLYIQGRKNKILTTLVLHETSEESSLRWDEIRDILMFEMSHESAKLVTFLVIDSSTLAKTKEC